jgi:hypothetical protein
MKNLVGKDVWEKDLTSKARRDCLALFENRLKVHFPHKRDRYAAELGGIGVLAKKSRSSPLKELLDNKIIIADRDEVLLTRYVSSLWVGSTS